MKKLILCLFFLTIFYSFYGQELPQVTDKIIIENITLTTRPGATPMISNVLVDDGIIVRVGSDFSVPYDAKVIPGDSLYAYAGFIAPLSNIGLKAPKENNERPKVDRTGYPPNDIAGITPEKSISDLYSSKDGSISDFRKQGFTIAHSVPHGRMMPGMGSVISLNGYDFNEAVIIKDHALYAQWLTAQGVFPATLIGIMAKWREMYRNAELANTHASLYKTSPQNRKRPSQDAATTALFPVINKQMTVFFAAEKHRDVSRTIQLKKELGFDLVLGEVRDIDRIIGKVQASGAKILLSLDLPEEEKKKKEEEKSKDEKSKDEKSETDQKIEHLKNRKAAAINRYTNQAKMLSEKGVPVTFSYLKTKSKDIHTNLRRLVVNGLSEEIALGSLTTEPARTLGISDITGTIEKGKIANLVITTGPLFNEKTKIKMVMVDGVIHTYDVTEKKKKSVDGEAVDVSGDWSYTIDVPGMTPSGTMTFTKNGETYDLKVTSNQNPGESVSTSGIEIDGNNMVFTYKMDAGGMSLSIDNDITFEDASFEGTVSVGDFGSFEITGTKSTPE